MANPQIEMMLSQYPEEERAAVLAELIASGQLEQTVTDPEIDATLDTNRAAESKMQAQRRLQTAMANRGAAQDDFFGSIGGTKGVPSPYGTMVVKQSPISQMIKALRMYKTGRDVKGAEGQETAAVEQDLGGVRKIAQAQRTPMEDVNAQRILAALLRRKQAAAPVETYDGEGY